jgi:DNA-binding CsgD family transcriptional regulator
MEEFLVAERDTNRPALPGPGGIAYLTPRQAEVLELATHGLSDKQIATYLGISARTVEDRFAEMRKSTGTNSKGELIAWGVAAGLVVPGSPSSCRSSRPARGKDTASPISLNPRVWRGTAERDGTAPPIPNDCDETGQVSSHCLMCGIPVTIALTGRPRAYCSPACRTRAYRARKQVLRNRDS